MELNFGIVGDGSCQCWSSNACDVWRLVNTFGAPNVIVRLLPKKAGTLRAQTVGQKEHGAYGYES